MFCKYLFSRSYGEQVKNQYNEYLAQNKFMPEIDIYCEFFGEHKYDESCKRYDCWGQGLSLAMLRCKNSNLFLILEVLQLVNKKLLKDN